jgi:RNA polymerase sigma-70 factor (ECF subfamily)
MTHEGPAHSPTDTVSPAQRVGEEAVAFLDGLFSTALRLTRDRAAAEDLVQDTYLKAVRFADRFEPGTNLRSWLYTILHNTFRNELRDAGRDPVDVDSDMVAAAVDRTRTFESPEDLLLRGALAADLRAALDDLPEVFRQAVWLRDVEDFSYAEIASMNGTPIGTVMSRIARGRRLMQQRLSTGRSSAGEEPGMSSRRTRDGRT